MIHIENKFYLRELRQANKLTQVELARMLGLKSSSTITMWENGSRHPPNMILPRLADNFFAVTTFICAFGWLINKIIAEGALLYIIEECGKAPVNGELGPYMKKRFIGCFQGSTKVRGGAKDDHANQRVPGADGFDPAAARC